MYITKIIFKYNKQEFALSLSLSLSLSLLFYNLTFFTAPQMVSFALC